MTEFISIDDSLVINKSGELYCDTSSYQYHQRCSNQYANFVQNCCIRKISAKFTERPQCTKSALCNGNASSMAHGIELHLCLYIQLTYTFPVFISPHFSDRYFTKTVSQSAWPSNIYMVSLGQKRLSAGVNINMLYSWRENLWVSILPPSSRQSIGYSSDVMTFFLYTKASFDYYSCARQRNIMRSSMKPALYRDSFPQMLICLQKCVSIDETKQSSERSDF